MVSSMPTLILEKTCSGATRADRRTPQPFFVNLKAF